MSAEIPYWWRVTPQIWVVLLIAGFVPFFEQKIHGLFKDFPGHFSHFWRTPFSAKKSLESVFFSSSTTWVILSQRSFCVCSFSLEFYLSYKFSIEIQGVSSTDCNFQGLSRQDFQVVANPVICHAAWQICFNQSEVPLRSGWSCIISFEFLCSFLRHDFMGKPWAWSMRNQSTLQCLPTTPKKLYLLCNVD